jgi:uncharacterized caspase-like protein
VRSDAQGGDILVSATAIADHAGPVDDADLDHLVLLRVGFDVVADRDE